MKYPTLHNRLLAVLLFSTLLACMTGCEKKGPAEALGAKVDQAVEETGDALQQAGETATTTVDEQLEKAKESMRDHPEH